MYNSVCNSVDNSVDAKGSFMTRKILLITCASALSLLILSACSRDENQVWEAVEYDGGVYDDDRTAGRGIRYVLKSMAPKKGAVLKAISPATMDVLPATRINESLVPLRISRRIDLGPMIYPLPEQATQIGVPNPPPAIENRYVSEPKTEVVATKKPVPKPNLEPKQAVIKDPKTLPEPKIKNASSLFDKSMGKSK